jgi:UDP:flavonoid glycosyltransferase YjiC (YdhE family)
LRGVYLLEVTGENGRTDHFAHQFPDHVYVANMISKMIRHALLSRGPYQLYLACQDLFASEEEDMQVAIITIGTRGDIQPYIALGQGLQAAGYDVKVVTCGAFESFVRDSGLDFAAVSGDLASLMTMDWTQSQIESGGKSMGSLGRVAQDAEGLLVQLMTDCLEVCEGAEALVGSVVGGLAGQAVAQKLGVPYCSAYLQPLDRTSAFANSFSLFPMPPRWLLAGKRAYNWTTHVLSARLFWLLFGKVLNRARLRALHLPAFSRKQRYPTLYGYSPTVLPKPANWDERITVTGYWFLDQAENWEPPVQLEQFLANGKPPVSIGFGSMAGRSAKKVLPLFLEAASLLGQRTVLLAKPEDVEGLELSENVFRIESVPHDWLFPHMAAVMHHGGAGTSGAAFRAGVPQIVLPFIADQHFGRSASRSLVLEQSPSSTRNSRLNRRFKP